MRPRTERPFNPVPDFESQRRRYLAQGNVVHIEFADEAVDSAERGFQLTSKEVLLGAACVALAAVAVHKLRG